MIKTNAFSCSSEFLIRKPYRRICNPFSYKLVVYKVFHAKARRENTQRTRTFSSEFVYLTYMLLEKNSNNGGNTLYSVPCTLYLVLCTLYSVLCTLYSVPCTLLFRISNSEALSQDFQSVFLKISGECQFFFTPLLEVVLIY
jgi:hypothetical protein